MKNKSDVPDTAAKASAALVSGATVATDAAVAAGTSVVVEAYRAGKFEKNFWTRQWRRSDGVLINSYQDKRFRNKRHRNSTKMVPPVPRA